jgi:hypothetical protein
MRYTFLSPEWFAQVEQLIAQAGDLKIPAEMMAVEMNVTVATAQGEAAFYIKDGLLAQGHRTGAATSITLPEPLARKVFVDGDSAAGVQAFLAGEIKAEGDLAKLVALSTVEPSGPQRELTKKIAAITA